MKLRSLMTSSFILTFALATALPAIAAEGTVEAVGEAQIENGKTVKAKKLATTDALRKCVELVVGIAIKSEFSMQQKETVKDNHSAFYSSVSDKLTQNTKGFIQTYEVLEENVVGDVMKVKVRAKVYESKIKAEVKKLADLLAAAGNPKVMLVIQDVRVSKEGKEKVEKESVFGAYLESELLARGFELRGKGAAKKLAKGSADKLDEWAENPKSVAKVAENAGADIVIMGRVEIRHKGQITEADAAGMDALIGQHRIELVSVVRGINAANGEIVSAKPVQMNSVGTTIERAIHRSFKGRGSNLVKRTFDQLLADLKTSFKKAADKGVPYVVKLRGIKSFRKQGRPFLKAIKALEGVSTAKQKSYDQDILVIELNCKCTVNELQERLFDALEDKKGFGNLDIAKVSGKRLTFKL
ncbi:flagellar assembly protein T N-terminal domain-containing protein [Myxococcota bacterium]|nr:flagellar assembly protein T N-terminal domain-containing protein [Myxococcota bacterium]